MAGTQSALLRQKGLAGKKLGVERGDLKKAGGATKGAAGKELSQAKKAAAPAHKMAAKDAAGLKSGAGVKKKAVLKSMAPTHSALLRQKGLADKKLGVKRGDLKKAGRLDEGQERNEGDGGGRSCPRPRRRAAPAHKMAAKDAAAG